MSSRSKSGRQLTGDRQQGGKKGPSSPLISSLRSGEMLDGSRSLAPAVFAVALSVYVRTAFRSVPGGDSGELLAESCTWGVGHPPGYPLFIMLYHFVLTLGSPLPLGDADNAAWRANVFSGFLGACAATLLYLAGEGLMVAPLGNLPRRNARWPAAGGALLFAFSPWVWLYGVGAEVFALNNCFACALVYLTVRCAQTKSTTTVSVGAFLCGFALCNQHTIVLFEAPLIGWILWSQRSNILSLGLGRTVLRWATFFAVGLSPYVYLPIAAALNRQPGSWGDPTTLGGFFHHLRRGDYGTFRLFARSGETAGMFERIALYTADFQTRQVPLGVGAVLALVGAASSSVTLRAVSTRIGSGRARPPRRSRGRGSASAGGGGTATTLTMDTPGVGDALLGAYIVYMCVFHFLSNMPLHEELLYGVQARFWMQPNAIAFLWLGIGLAETLRRLPVPIGANRQALFASVVVVLVAVQLGVNWHEMDQASNAYLEGYARAVIETLPEGAVLLTNYDQQWTSSRYVQRCLGVRPDVTTINLSMMTYAWFAAYRDSYPSLTFPGTHLVATGTPSHNEGGFSFKEFLDANLANVGGVFVGGSLPFAKYDQSYNALYGASPVGLLREFTQRRESVSSSGSGLVMPWKMWYPRATAAWDVVDAKLSALPPPDKYSAETWEWTVARDYFEHLADYAAEVLSHGVDSDNVHLMVEASIALERVFLHDRAYCKAAALKNLGLAYVKIGQSKSKTDVNPAAFSPHAAVPSGDASEAGWLIAIIKRAVVVWDEWVSLEAAKADQGYEGILATLPALKKIVAGNAGASPHQQPRS